MLLGNGSGSFATPTTTDLGYGYHAGAAAADFNDDGKDDFATADGYSTVKVLLANPDGSGTLLAPTGFAAEYPYSVAAGDVNGDGIDDLVTRSSSGVNVLMGNGVAGVGNGSFAAAIHTALDYYPASIAMGDFNDDGKLDLGVGTNLYVFDGWGYYGPYSHYEQKADVLLGYGNGNFTAPVRTPLASGWVNGVASGDFDGDGFSDLAVVNSSNNNFTVLINDELWEPLPPPPVSISDAVITEGHSGTTNATFTVSLKFAHDEDVTIHYTTADSSATADSDYTAVSGDVTIFKGTTTATFTVPVRGDRVGEQNEAFLVNLSGTDAPLADGTGVGSIMDDEPRVWLGDVTVAEGNSGSANAMLPVNLLAAYDQDVTVHYSTSDGSASAGSDYTGVTDATVTIPAGQTTGNATIAVMGDRVGEWDEYFNVTLSGATNSLITDNWGYGTIQDNEPRISISDVSKAEGTTKGRHTNPTQFVFVVTLSATYDQAVTVTFSTADGTAKVSNNDYVATSGTVTFAPGDPLTKIITVSVKGDKTREQNEWFALNLTASSTNVFQLDNQGIGWILNDDRHGGGGG